MDIEHGQRENEYCGPTVPPLPALDGVGGGSLFSYDVAWSWSRTGVAEERNRDPLSTLMRGFTRPAFCTAQQSAHTCNLARFLIAAPPFKALADSGRTVAQSGAFHRLGSEPTTAR
jgi:hypothetical protein